MSVSLDNYSDHPLNRGWMNVFRRWTSSRIFQTHWPAVRGEFSEGFVRFCEDELNLTVADPEVIWLDPAMPPPHPGSPQEFRGAVVELDKEFSLEWPDVILREIRDRRSGLIDIFDFAVKYPAAPGNPKAGLVVPGTVAVPQQSTSEPPQYGLIVAWKSSDGVIDLVIWLRGAYRTLGLGDSVKGAIKKLKDQIEAIYPEGYILRARYPRDNRSKGKQGWQGTLWTDFFQNQGFHHEESARLDEEWDSLIYRFTARRIVLSSPISDRLGLRHGRRSRDCPARRSMAAGLDRRVRILRNVFGLPFASGCNSPDRAGPEWRYEKIQIAVRIEGLDRLTNEIL